MACAGAGGMLPQPSLCSWLPAGPADSSPAICVAPFARAAVCRTLFCPAQPPASSVSTCAPSCLSEHSSSRRVPQAGVQRTNLARALLHMQQLPAAHRVAVLHPRPEGLLLCPLLREQVCSSLHSLQKGTAGRAARNPRPVVQGCVPCSCHEGVVGWCWGGPPSPLAGRRGQGTRGWPSCCLSVAALLQQCQGCAGCAPTLSKPHQKKVQVP